MKRTSLFACLAFAVGVPTLAAVAHADSIGLYETTHDAYYVALGDSYTSGPLLSRPVGRDPYASSTPEETERNGPVDCGKSDQNYPHLLAEYLGLFNSAHPEATFHEQSHHPGFVDISCGSARTKHMWETQNAAFDFVNRAQFDVFSDTTMIPDPALVKLVSIGIGGNDLGFGALQDECVERPLQESGYRCSSGYFNAPSTAPDADGRTHIQYKLDQLEARLKVVLAGTTHELSGGDVVHFAHDEFPGETLDGVLDLAPEAEVLIVGYPALLPHDEDGLADGEDDGCFPYIPVFPEDAAALSLLSRQLNDRIEEVADRFERVHYVDWYAPSAIDPLTGGAHDMCQPPGLAWTNGVVLAPPSFPVHPNALGTRGAAEAAVRRIEGRPYRLDGFEQRAPIDVSLFPGNPRWITTPDAESVTGAG